METQYLTPPENDPRRHLSWVEIDLAALAGNVRALRRQVGEQCQLMAVVKGDAYGHGAVPCAQTCLAAGADLLAVARLEEALALRQAGIEAPILCLGALAVEQVAQAIQARVMLTAYHLAAAQIAEQEAARLGMTAQLHVKLDTGLCRLGLACDADHQELSLAELAQMAALPHCRLQGVFSHFAVADGDTPAEQAYTRSQLAAFCRFVAAARQRGIPLPVCHLANSGAICDLPESYLDLVRPGIILYGSYPSPSVKRIAGIRPVMTVKSHLVQLHRLPAGGSVSYGCTWHAAQDSLIATVPLGYADGVPRLLSNGGSLLLHGQRVPIVGRVCMDQLMVDVSQVSGVAEGDEVVFLGCQGDQQIPAEEIAARAGTITHEIFIHLASRLPFVYLPA